MPSEETQFQPGQSGNPNGRPKGTLNLGAMLNRALCEEVDFTDPVTYEKIKKKLGDVVVLQLIKSAVKGDIRAIQEIFNRIDGRPAFLEPEQQGSTSGVLAIPYGGNMTPDQWQEQFGQYNTIETESSEPEESNKKGITRA